MKILDGKIVAEQRAAELKNEFEKITKQIQRKPILAIIQVGENPSSDKYIEKKIAKAQELGVDARVYRFPDKIRYKSLLKKLDDINDEADGVIVQLPLPESLSTYTQPILDAVRWEKDVDGLSTRNTFNFYNKTDDFSFTPATAQAIMTLIDYYNIEVSDKRVAVIGRSNLVGKPTAALFKNRNAAVSTHNRESGIKGVENADILVVATGVPNLICKKHIKEGAVVIDVGTTWIEKDNKRVLCGDVNQEGLAEHISALAPTPGGVGPLTVICLFQNLLNALKNNHNI
ncbi:bifunctional 5,10-methylenetetrahydrofolate dehydrogenase/5,10-methenyltetrahydrofolate cyclohydrolase [Mycoplasma zalophidermidis]|uniref:Bifunctional protein FolD n=1 Tax=Mycoplasma zalophidermidis TaxID=398174 RepID=A0ABS6DSX2_9MOLU|nr:bifunctional 5,10-methylenetetrahydrofolate dehydrogenase/5,10-methenyltetrahydrofolate cyclohydrolase [Mycoplasma zalophidermidis]MBU4689778.1 bifunctional 5,10-methylenetetrahydrofolate dehydrogenase/5,10-methenyltetrahydrofolate cyclohydrolase [Mycoplasma zalophidermidis]MBU4693710.1 bifunctional 5,10-methylenetetrahydrofolate dehydrogenase/5,10-methenyltetrahydrofolate cyclohydrolase [Mycoplasma zalophidermidis]MCR8966591.1 bifunctional 5,10-methylenetetrahydrofolate dehydrogenase/5,10-me